MLYNKPVAITKVIFTDHARYKLAVLARHGLTLSPEAVEGIVRSPVATGASYGGRSVATGPLDEKRVWRVIYEERGGDAYVITVYPARKGRYGKNEI